MIIFMAQIIIIIIFNFILQINYMVFLWWYNMLDLDASMPNPKLALDASTPNPTLGLDVTASTSMLGVNTSTFMDDLLSYSMLLLIEYI